MTEQNNQYIEDPHSITSLPKTWIYNNNNIYQILTCKLKRGWRKYGWCWLHRSCDREIAVHWM